MNLHSRNFIPELNFKTSRSSGAGGQNVNKTETKVELIFDVKNSTQLSSEEKALIVNKLANQINDAGELRISSSESRSQASNKEIAIEKFYALLEKALKKEKKRIPTKIPKVVKEQILQSKKLHSQKKAERRFNARNL
jgi:ribosome-associated protein